MKPTFPTRRTPLALAVGTALSLAGTQALAQEQAGRVLAASGTIVASTPSGTRTLSRGSRVFTGETIETRDGRLQIRFIDGALVSLQPDTRFEVARYELRDSSTGDPDDGGSVLMRLFRGALRTITGAIDADENESYRVETPVATIGVRGTQYGLQYCDDGSCGEAPDGLYGHVTDGNVYVGNEGGNGIFGGGLFFRVGDRNQAPQGILEPPGGVLRDQEQDDGEGGDGIDGDGEGDGGATSGPSVAEGTGDDGGVAGPLFSESEETGVAATQGITAAVAGSLIGPGVSEGGACTSPVNCTAQLNENGELVLLDSSFTSVDVASGAALVTSGASTNPELAATYGHWKGGLAGGDFLWAYSTNPTTAAELSDAFRVRGPLNFSIDTGPAAVSNLGNTWAVTSINVGMSVDILNGTATIGIGAASLSLDDNANFEFVSIQNRSAATIDPSAGNLGFDLSMTGTCGSSDTGNMQGLFIGDGAEGLVVEFEAFNSETIETIRGVQILEDASLN